VTTEFRIGSVSKPLTAAGAMLLVQDGKLDLDAPVQRYVPSFPAKPWPITARELGGHLAGVRHYQGHEFASDVRYDSVVASLAIFASDPLLFEPGTKYAYSSYGYDLLSAEMETAAGMPFLDFMQARVLSPLGLTHTEPDRAGATVADRATFYVRTSHGAVVAPPVDLSCKWAAGGYLSTPHDLVRFASSLLAPGFLAQSSIDLLFSPMKTRDGALTSYGFGWEIERDRRGRQWKFHKGAAMGGETTLQVLPERRLVVALTANASDEGDHAPRTSYGMTKSIAEAFADAL
jgi:CubicO group peptidase (beta-lactamase class C family)